MRIALILLLTGIAAIASSQPQQEVKVQIDSLLSYIQGKNTESFAKYTAYRGEDKQREWIAVYDPANKDELKEAKKVMERMKETLGECNGKQFDDFREETESEGTWYIYSYSCGKDKKIHLAFLKIGNIYVLGDIDVEK